MASFTERIRLVFDVDNNGALSGFAGFKKSIAEADGFTGKFKAGLGSLKQGFGQFITSGAGMATAATAVAGGLYKATSAAFDLELEVGKLSDATGLTTQAASRWIEVLKDIGLPAEKVAGLIEKLTKNLGSTPEKFAALGVEVQRTADGTVDMNATLLDAIDALNGITDPTKRAALAQQLFGKSWSDASELITMGADNLKKRLADVSGAKIMTPEQIQQARDFRDSMDKLKDVAEEVMLQVGKALIPVLTDLGDVLGTVTDIAGGVDDALGSISGGAIGLGDVIATAVLGPIYPLAKGIGYLDSQVIDLNATMRDAAIAIAEHQKAADDMAQAVTWEKDGIQALGTAMHDAGPSAQELEDAQRRLNEQAAILKETHRTLAEKIRDVQRAWDVLTGKFDNEDAVANAVLSLSGLQDKLDAIAASSDTAIQKQAETALAFNGTTESVMDTLKQLGFLSPALAEKFEVLIESGQVDEAIRKLEWLQQVAAAMSKPGWFDAPKLPSVPGAMQAFAGGTNNAPGGTALVGEKGPELVNLPAGSQVIPADRTAAMLNGGPTAGEAAIIAAINASAKATARAVVQAMRAA